MHCNELCEKLRLIINICPNPIQLKIHAPSFMKKKKKLNQAAVRGINWK